MKLSVVPKTEPLAAAAEAEPLYVLKFGSSVLRTIADLPRVAGEIYRQRRSGRRIVVVVSALAGETDRLLAEAQAVADGRAGTGVADLVSLGEERAAALLHIACDRIGLPTAICRPEELGLRTAGDRLNAHPIRLELGRLAARLDAVGVVIVPGFVGLGEDGRRTLLGRGGSDYSAVFLGGELDAACVRLYKDVDGVYDRDPALAGDARRFAEISWSDALSIARPLIQPQAVEYAASRRLPIEVEAIGSFSPTRVASRTSAAEAASNGRPLRIAIAGFGVVGQALAARLRNEAGFEVAAILVRDVERERRVRPPCPPTADFRAFVESSADIVVDALSCERTGRRLCAESLAKGVHVASASKRAICAGYGELSAAATAGGSRLLYSSAVGGGAPILETVARARTLSPVSEFAGILNGTVNFILDRLARGLDFEQALGEARSAGFAELDSDADLSGADAAAKLRLVAAEAFGLDPHALEIETEWLDPAAVDRIQASGERWIQLARIVRGAGGIDAKVTLQPLSQAAELAETEDEWNKAVVTLEDGRALSCLGRGAGGAATAEAIVADLFDIVALQDQGGRPVMAQC